MCEFIFFSIRFFLNQFAGFVLIACVCSICLGATNDWNSFVSFSVLRESINEYTTTVCGVFTIFSNIYDGFLSDVDPPDTDTNTCTCFQTRAFFNFSTLFKHLVASVLNFGEHL